MAIVLMVVADGALLKVMEEAQELGRNFDAHLQARFGEFLLSTDPTLAPPATKGYQPVASEAAQEREDTLDQLLVMARKREDQFTFKELAQDYAPLVNAPQQEITKYASLFAKVTKDPHNGVRNLGKQGGSKGVTLYSAAIPQTKSAQ